MLSREWRCIWSSAERWCSNYIWVIKIVIAYQCVTYIRGLTVSQIPWLLSTVMVLSVYEGYAFVFHLEEFQLCTPSQIWEMIKNANIFWCVQKINSARQWLILLPQHPCSLGLTSHDAFQSWQAQIMKLLNNGQPMALNISIIGLVVTLMLWLELFHVQHAENWSALLLGSAKTYTVLQFDEITT